jgi:hypothetical protein
LTDRAYNFATFQDGDVITSPTFPGLKLMAVEVLRAGAIMILPRGLGFGFA